MNRFVIALSLIAICSFVSADTYTNESFVTWSYSDPLPDDTDGFKLRANGDVVWTGKERVVAIADLNLGTGRFALSVTAYNAAGESAVSNTLTPSFVTVGPAEAPVNLMIMSTN